MELNLNGWSTLFTEHLLASSFDGTWRRQGPSSSRFETRKQRDAWVSAKFAEFMAIKIECAIGPQFQHEMKILQFAKKKFECSEMECGFVVRLMSIAQQFVENVILRFSPRVECRADKSIHFCIWPELVAFIWKFIYFANCLCRLLRQPFYRFIVSSSADSTTPYHSTAQQESGGEMPTPRILWSIWCAHFIHLSLFAVYGLESRVSNKL